MTKKKKNPKRYIKRKSELQAALNRESDAQRQKKVEAIVMLDEIEVFVK